MPTPELSFALTITDAVPHARGSTLLTLDGADDFVSAHQTPGQYVFARAPGFDDARPFALANPPGAAPAILYKSDDDVTDWVGQDLKLSGPQGPGFPIALAAGAPAVFIATGTALAPLRAALVSDGQRALTSTQVLVGARTPDAVCFRDDLDALRAAGATVTVTVTVPDADWAGAVGRVQAHLDTLTLTAETWAFVCGQFEMQTETKAALIERGLSDEKVRFNF